jgi:cell wall-associated NlpC family hydrolase
MIAIDRYLGKPFAWGGDGPEVYDCYGLVCAVLREQFGIDCPPMVGPRAPTRTQDFAAEVAAADCPWRPVLAEQIRPGDVLAFSVPAAGGDELHVGIVVGPGTMLHTMAAAGVTLGRFDRPPLVLARVGPPYRHRDLVLQGAAP